MFQFWVPSCPLIEPGQEPAVTYQVLEEGMLRSRYVKLVNILVTPEANKPHVADILVIHRNTLKRKKQTDKCKKTSQNLFNLPSK